MFNISYFQIVFGDGDGMQLDEQDWQGVPFSDEGASSVFIGRVDVRLSYSHICLSKGQHHG